MFRNSSPLFRIACFLLAIPAFFILMVFGTSLFYNPNASDFIKAISQPYTMNEQMERTDTFHPGDAIMIHFENRKIENGCFAEFMVSFTGPVSFQTNLGKSHFLGDRGTVHEFETNSYMELPKKIPGGHYNVKVNVFPTCNGIDRDPFTIDSDPINIIVEK